MTKVLFLDIDGVVNSSLDFAHPPKGQKAPYIIVPDKVKLITEVVDKTGSRIVLSSTWRNIPSAVDFIEVAFPDISSRYHPDWKTIRGQVDSPAHEWRASRGHEIKEWLSRHPEVTRYAIVDDDAEDIRPIYPLNLVQTTWFKGIQPEHAKRLIGLLND